MTIAELDAQIAQLKARRAKLIAKQQQERQAQRAAQGPDRRPLSEWIFFDGHGLPRRSLSLAECRRYAVVSGTKLAVILIAADDAGIPVDRSEALDAISEAASGELATG